MLTVKSLRVLITSSLLLISASALASIEAYEFDSQQQEALFKELTKELRCPKCQNNNIADSNAPLAQDLREKTYEMVKSGNSKDDVLDYMVARYGNFVRYDPPLTPAVLTLWIAPVLIIVVGSVVLWAGSRRKAKDSELDQQEQARLAALIKQTEQDEK